MFAFHGHTTFEIRIILQGKSVTRDVRVCYAYTPEWPFLDSTVSASVTRPSSIELHIEIRGRQRGRRAAPLSGSTGWLPVDALLGEDVLSPGMRDLILDRVDWEARRQDAERRGLSEPTNEHLTDKL